MAAKKVLEIRPFRSDLDGPFPDSLPVCGLGEDKQIDLHPSRLFDIATRKNGLYFKELVGLTRKLNSVFAREGPALLRKKQKDLKDNTIELTIALYKGGLYLTYAKPVRKRAQRRKRA
ncbi:MAG: hypothetical protein M3547_05680 [Acidobacteriota bacterium]|nr:hypothetical protein [Acidobacteriota bacterium]